MNLNTFAFLWLAWQDVAPVAQGYTATEVLLFITAVGAVIVNIITAWRTGAKVDTAIVKTEALAAKVQEVKVATDGGLTAVKAELSTSNALNQQLHSIIADLKSERAATAVAVARETPTANS